MCTINEKGDKKMENSVLVGGMYRQWQLKLEAYFRTI